MKSSVVLFALVMGASVCSAYGGGQPPRPITPVSWVLHTQHNDNEDERRVVMIGQVTHHDSGTDWWFTDGTGSVRLENNDRRLPVGPTLRIVGRIDQATWGIGVIEVQVKKWSFVQPPQVPPPPVR